MSTEENRPSDPAREGLNAGGGEISVPAYLESATSESVIAERARNLTLWVPAAFEEAVVASAMVLLTVITIGNVVTRYLTNVSFAFTEEYSSFLLFVVVFASVSISIIKNNHIRMTFFTELMSRKNQKVCEILGCVGIILCFSDVLYYGTLLTSDSYSSGETSSGLGYPVWIYLIWLPLLSLLAILRACGALLRILSASSE